MRLPEDMGFWASPGFGPIDPETYDHLLRVILEGNGSIIPGAGGFRQIEIPPDTPVAGNEGLLVVFAVYIRQRIVVLTNSYAIDSLGFIQIPVENPELPLPLESRKKLTTEQQQALARCKKRLDDAVKEHFR